MPWGQIGAAAITSGASLLGNAMQYASSKKLMNRQHKLQKQYAQYIGENSHQWTVKDLQAAGLNPVLSATQGANATSGGNVGLPQTPDYAGSLQSAVQNYMDNKRINNETQVAESTADLNDANATKARKESGVIDAKTNQEIKESESRIVKNKAETNEIKSNQELLQAKRIEALNNSGAWGQYLLAKHFGGELIEATAGQLKRWKEEHEEKMKNDPKYRKMWEEADLTEGIFGN